jgi:glycosyltransferase involved in cell wall biosynthesis
MVSRLEPLKGVEDIIDAYAGKNLALHVYGDGSLRNALSQRSVGTKAIVFHGHVKDVQKRLSQYAILVSPSYSESFSYSVAEAVQAGLLCVVSDIPAHRELLGKEYPDELFFEPGNLAEIRAAVSNAEILYKTDGSAKAFAAIQVARERIRTRNSPEVARKGYLQVLY